MSDWNGFGSLDLSDVEESSGSTMLREGEHVVKCEEAAMEEFGGSNKRLRCVFAAVDGKGKLGHSFNLVHTSSSMAQEIGRRMLKSFLVAGGHPSPDKPGDVGTCEGLITKVYVGMGKPYTKDGVEKQYPEIKSFDAATDDDTPAKQLDDAIPF